MIALFRNGSDKLLRNVTADLANGAVVRLHYRDGAVVRFRNRRAQVHRGRYVGRGGLVTCSKGKRRS
jgi:hypothetical protein